MTFKCCEQTCYLYGVQRLATMAQTAPFLPQVVSSAQDEVGFGVERGAHLAQPAVTAGTLKAVLVPVLIKGLQQVTVLDLPVAAGTAFWLGVRLDGEHLYTWEKHTTSIL